MQPQCSGPAPSSSSSSDTTTSCLNFPIHEMAQIGASSVLGPKLVDNPNLSSFQMDKPRVREEKAFP